MFEGRTGAEYLIIYSLGEDSRTAEYAWEHRSTVLTVLVTHSQTDKSDKCSLKHPRSHISETVLPSQNIALVKMDSTQALMESKVNLLGLFHSSHALSGCCHGLSETRLGRFRQRYHLRIGQAAWGSKWSDGVLVKNLAPKNQI